MPSEMPLTSRERYVCHTCGTKLSVVSTAAAEPTRSGRFMSFALRGPCDERVDRALHRAGVRMVRDRDHDPALAAGAFDVARHAVHVAQAAGLQVRGREPARTP